MWSFSKSWLISAVLVHYLSVSLTLSHFKNITPRPPLPPPPLLRRRQKQELLFTKKLCDISNHITQQSKRLQMSFPQTDK